MTTAGASKAAVSLWRVTRTVVVIGVLTAANYLGWLGWDQRKDVHPDGHLTGPYQAWQVIGLVVVLGVIAAVAGWRNAVASAGLTTAVVTGAAFSVDASTDTTGGASFWPIGAFLVVVGTLLGVTLVASLSSWLAPRCARVLAWLTRRSG